MGLIVALILGISVVGTGSEIVESPARGDTFATGERVSRMIGVQFSRPSVNSAIQSEDRVGSVRGVTYMYHQLESGNWLAIVANSPDKRYVAMSRYSGDWSIESSRDPMTDRVTCILRYEMKPLSGARDYASAFTVVYGGTDTTFLVTVGDHHFPRSDIQIRIDTSPMLGTAASSGFSNSSALIASAINGRAITTRFMKWPYESWNDFRVSTYGLDVAIDMTRWLYTRQLQSGIVQ